MQLQLNVNHRELNVSLALKLVIYEHTQKVKDTATTTKGVRDNCFN